MCLTTQSHWRCGHHTHKSRDLCVKARFSSSKSECTETTKLETRHCVRNACKQQRGMEAKNMEVAKEEKELWWKEKRAAKAKDMTIERRTAKERRRLSGKEVVKKVKKGKLSEEMVTEAAGDDDYEVEKGELTSIRGGSTDDPPLDASVASRC